MAKILRQATPGTRLGLVSVLAKPKRGKQIGQGNREKQIGKARETRTMTLVKRTLHVNTAHQLLGHMGERSTRAVGKHLGWTIVRSAYRPCAACARAKIKTKAIVPDGQHEIGNQITGRMVFIDISSVKTKGLQVARPY